MNIQPDHLAHVPCDSHTYQNPGILSEANICSSRRHAQVSDHRKLARHRRYRPVSTVSSANPSYFLPLTVWTAVAVTRGSAATASKNRRAPVTIGSSLDSSSTAPSRTTLSATITVPARDRRSAHARYSALCSLSASRKIKSNGAPPSAASS